MAQFLAISAWRWRDANQPLGRFDFGVFVASWDYLLALLCRPSSTIAARHCWCCARHSLMPKLSAAEAHNRMDEVTKVLGEAIIFAGFFILPAMVSLIILAGPIIEGLFLYGAFTTDDVLMAAMALSAYAAGLPGFVLVKILQPAFYAAGHPGIVLKISIMTVVINVTGSLIMMPLFGHVGLALATSLSGLIAAVVMAILLLQRRRLGVDWLFMLGRVLLATLVMSVVLFTLKNFGAELQNSVPSVFWLAGLVILGGAVFFVSAIFFKAIPVGFARRWWTRKA